MTPQLINGLRRHFVLWCYKKLFNLQIKSYTVLQDNRTKLNLPTSAFNILAGNSFVIKIC